MHAEGFWGWLTPVRLADLEMSMCSIKAVLWSCAVPKACDCRCIVSYSLLLASVALLLSSRRCSSSFLQMLYKKSIVVAVVCRVDTICWCTVVCCCCCCCLNNIFRVLYLITLLLVVYRVTVPTPGLVCRLALLAVPCYCFLLFDLTPPAPVRHLESLADVPFSVALLPVNPRHYFVAADD